MPLCLAGFAHYFCPSHPKHSPTRAVSEEQRFSRVRRGRNGLVYLICLLINSSGCSVQYDTLFTLL